MTVLPSGPRTPLDPALVPRALDVAGRLANEAADVIVATAGRAGPTRGGGPVPDESPFDWVTDTDRTLERHTRRVLAAEFPGMPVIGQEFGPVAVGGTGPASDYRWVVDPVDGTANFLAGLPWCAYSLALLDGHGPVVGVVADPYRAQIYAAARGKGARANGTTVRVPVGVGIAGRLVCTELTRVGPWPGMGAFAERAAGARSGIRVLGCAALAVAQVALGHAMAAVLHGYHERDVAGAVAFALEAGAVVLDRRGDAGRLPTDGLLVAAPDVAEEVHRWWTDALTLR